MSLTARDRKVVMVIVPVLLVAAYWFLLLSPKWDEAAAAGEELTKQEQRRDAALVKLRGLEASRQSFAADYASVVRLGKAVPTSTDMASLMVQLDRAAGGAGVDFSSVKAGERQTGASASAGPSGGGAGKGSATSTSTSSSAGGGQGGGVPVGGGGGAPGSTSPGSAPTPALGLDTVPLQFMFRGSYFRLADLLHEAKRFVYLADDDSVQVRGRLVTIDGFKLTIEQDKPGITAEITSTVYLSPEAQGPTAGASPQGPATQPAGASSESSTGSSAGSTSTAAANP